MREHRPAAQTRPIRKAHLRRLVGALLWGGVSFGSFLLSGCTRSGLQSQGGETNFLVGCDTSCRGDYECLSGVCTVGCGGDDGACDAQPGSAQCVGDESDEDAHCDVTCDRNSDCDALGILYTCEAGYCRAPGTGAPQSTDVDGGTGPRGANGEDRSEASGFPGGALAPDMTPLGAADDLAAPLDSGFRTKLDLLFMIDNSISMADKQELLGLAVPQLIERLANPVCVDAQGNVTSTASIDVTCPAGTARQVPPLDDIHVGIVTSSMGDAGANEACVFSPGLVDAEQKVDNGYLLGSLARGGQVAPGFLAWTGGDPLAFSDRFRDQVIQAGEFGCGYEASLEAWYHFLVDPTPWSAIDVVDCPGQAEGSGNCRQPRIAQPDGTLGDPVILAQRELFLRPDSLVGIVMVTDENDCSFIVGGPYNLAARTSRRMFRGSDSCAVSPNDPCCYSCGMAAPDGCDESVECGGDLTLPNELDEPNLRCYEQKRRFGLDFLYPTERYVNALTQPALGLCSLDLDPDTCEDSDIALNPLFRAYDGTLARDTSDVFLAGIVGVPWQLVQANADPSGNPYPGNELHFLTHAQLSDTSTGQAAWERIAGDPNARDAHMLESISSDDVAGRPGLPTADNPGSDPINGHEWTASRGDDLQYACIMPLLEKRDCDGPDFADGPRGCDCRGAGDAGYTENNPLCYQDGQYSSVQTSAKAYPALRHLDVLRDFGDETGNAIVGSICARNVQGDPHGQDFGYNPTMSAIVDRIAPKLSPGCFPRPLVLESVDGERRGRPECTVVEVTQRSAVCECPVGERRVPASDEIVTQIVGSGVCASADDCDVCFCELLPAGANTNGVVTDPDAYARCQTEETPDVDGWCYVDAEVPVITGDAALEASKNALVAGCPNDQRQILRFAGKDGPASGSSIWLSCTP